MASEPAYIYSFRTEEGPIHLKDCVVIMGNDTHHRMLNEDYRYGGKSSYIGGDGTITVKGRELTCSTCAPIQGYGNFMLALRKKDYHGTQVSCTKKITPPKWLAHDDFETEEYLALNGDTFRVTYWGKRSGPPLIVNVVYTFKPENVKDDAETPIKSDNNSELPVA